MITAAIAIAAIVVTALVTLHANDSHFRWWWPTNWMAIPVTMLLIGLIILIFPVRNSSTGREAPSTTAVGLATAKRIKYERMVEDILSEAVRELSCYEGAKQLGGLNLVLDYLTEFGTKLDAAVMSGRGEYVAVHVKHSFAKVSFMQMSYAIRQVVGLPPKLKAFTLLFISNQEPASEVDVIYLSRAFRPGTFSYIRLSNWSGLSAARH
jgi:hypothetical protein